MATDIKKIVEYKNRYGDVLEFSRISESEFMVHDIPSFFARRSMTDSGEIVMYDPSGGPYLGAEIGGHSGTNMGYYDGEWEGLIVYKIEILENNTVKLYCHGGNIEWDIIK